MDVKNLRIDRNKTNTILEKLSADFFKAAALNSLQKKQIFSEIKKGIAKENKYFQELIVKEVKLTKKDAQKEVERAYKTFTIAEENTDYVLSQEITRSGKKIIEKRVARGPLFVITPFSSPLSSPAHKIAAGLLVGTSILFKPSRFAKLTGIALYKIIRSATKGKYVYFYSNTQESDLQKVVSDDRVGIISFTGGYETGKKIIQKGGVKKYHMELAGGNSPVIFTPRYKDYNDQLAKKFLDGIMAKNGQRCVSIKHIFIPVEHKDFIIKIQNKLLSIKNEIKKNLWQGKENILGPLITEEYAKHTESKVHTILREVRKYIPLIEFEREKDYVYPSMYSVSNINENGIKQIINYDIPGPVVFIYFYKSEFEYEQILATLRKDYIRSGLQLSFYTNDISSVKKASQNLLWGGIIINDIPTYRNEFMSFGGFGKAGLGKEGFFETLQAYTDPQVTVYNS